MAIHTAVLLHGRNCRGDPCYNNDSCLPLAMIMQNDFVCCASELEFSSVLKCFTITATISIAAIDLHHEPL